MNIVLEAGIAIYVALAVALSVWIGIFIYLWRLDGQARELRRRLDTQPGHETTTTPTATLRTQKEPGTENQESMTENREPRAENI